VAAVAWLIANGADIELLGKRNQTALHIASDAGEDEVVEMLLAHGANVHAIDAHAETPLSLADNDETRTLLKAALIRVRKEG
jgi:ankyrin